MKTIIIGNCNEKIKDKLKLLGFELVFVQDNPNLEQSIKNHADLSIIKLPNGEVIIEQTQKELINKLKAKNIKVSQTKEKLTSPYPKDTILNFAIVGKFIIGNHKNTDETLKQKIEENSLTKLQTNQGYANCSTLVISENAIITDDITIAKIAKENKIDTLLIEKGDIKLEGQAYGFIGGASMMLENKKALFFGDITKHRNFEQIKIFLHKHECKFDYIEDYPLTDIGSAVGVYFFGEAKKCTKK